jgi:hypothetical protein
MKSHASTYVPSLSVCLKSQLRYCAFLDSFLLDTLDLERLHPIVPVEMPTLNGSA